MIWIFSYIFFNTVYSQFVFDEAVALVMSVLAFVLAYYCGSLFYAEQPEEKAQQYCVQCQKLTGQSFIHCRLCERCVPIEYIHTKLTNKCTDSFLLKRLIRVMKVYIILSCILTLVYAFKYLPQIAVVFVHLYMLKSIYVTGKEIINKT